MRIWSQPPLPTVASSQEMLGRALSLPFQSDCPFVEAADGWTVEYCEKRCEVRRVHLKQWATCPPHLCSPYLLLCLSVFFIFPPNPHTYSAVTAVGCVSVHAPLPAWNFASWQRQHIDNIFSSKTYWNYYTEEPDIGPCVLSIKQEEEGKNFR